MTDVTLLVMAADNPVADDEVRWRRGEIIDIFPLEQCPGPAGHPRHIHVHVTGVPYTLEQIKRRLTRVHADDEDDTILRARRRWAVDVSTIPAAARQAMLTNREITVTYTQAKNHIRRRLQLSRVLDAFLTDADLD